MGATDGNMTLSIIRLENRFQLSPELGEQQLGSIFMNGKQGKNGDPIQKEKREIKTRTQREPKAHADKESGPEVKGRDKLVLGDGAISM